MFPPNDRVTQAIRDEVDMEVRNLYTFDTELDIIYSEIIFHLLHELFGYGEKMGDEFIWRISHPDVFFFGYQECMSFGDRIDIQKGETLLVFIDFGARNFTIDDAREK
jgi:hypothetical protein